MLKLGTATLTVAAPASGGANRHVSKTNRSMTKIMKLSRDKLTDRCLHCFAERGGQSKHGKPGTQPFNASV
jgi:hypothetical protein